MLLHKTAREVSAYVYEVQKNGLSVGFVPTMGALHHGHISLINRACKENDRVICSIFVNPTQFNNPDDLSKYPRDFYGDFQKLKQTNCSVLFYPNVSEIYPESSEGDIEIGYLNTVLEGKHRPGHFKGVAMVIKRFFEIVKPDRAYFGLKDYQQYLVVNQINSNLGLGVNVIGCQTLREGSGLARSSRNRLLSKEGKEVAKIFFECLVEAREMIFKHSIAEIKQHVSDRFRSSDLCELEYFEITEARTLAILDNIPPETSVVACVAGYVENIRLIDNLILIP